MLRVIVPIEYVAEAEAFIEEQTIMTCEDGVGLEGGLVISNYNDAPDSEFWEFVDALLDALPFGAQVKISK